MPIWLYSKMCQDSRTKMCRSSAGFSRITPCKIKTVYLLAISSNRQPEYIPLIFLFTFTTIIFKLALGVTPRQNRALVLLISNYSSHFKIRVQLSSEPRLISLYKNTSTYKSKFNSLKLLNPIKFRDSTVYRDSQGDVYQDYLLHI